MGRERVEDGCVGVRGQRTLLRGDSLCSGQISGFCSSLKPNPAAPSLSLSSPLLYTAPCPVTQQQPAGWELTIAPWAIIVRPISNASVVYWISGPSDANGWCKR